MAAQIGYMSKPMNTKHPVNKTCPWSGDEVSQGALTKYNGTIVGFCNTGCRDKFDRAINMFDNCLGVAGAGPLKRNFLLHAQYNSWINKNMFDAAAKLSVEDINKDAGAFFGSIIGTLNHILVWDTTWLQRFAEHSIEYSSLKTIKKHHSPTSNEEILYAELDALQIARSAMDATITEFISETTEQDYDTIFSYHRVSGQKFYKKFGGMIQHVFNHQTHHRGQVTTLLFQMGVDPGVTDLLETLKEEQL